MTKRKKNLSKRKLVARCGNDGPPCSKIHHCPLTRIETEWKSDQIGRSRTISGGVCIKAAYGQAPE